MARTAASAADAAAGDVVIPAVTEDSPPRYVVVWPAWSAFIEPDQDGVTPDKVTTLDGREVPVVNGWAVFPNGSLVDATVGVPQTQFGVMVTIGALRGV